MAKNLTNKACQSSKNNPDPTPFIRIKKELSINETEEDYQHYSQNDFQFKTNNQQQQSLSRKDLNKTSLDETLVEVRLNNYIQSKTIEKSACKFNRKNLNPIAFSKTKNESISKTEVDSRNDDQIDIKLNKSGQTVGDRQQKLLKKNHNLFEILAVKGDENNNQSEISEIYVNKVCKSNRNNPDPMPFIRIKNEPTIEIALNDQNNSAIAVKHNTYENGPEAGSQDPIQNILNNDNASLDTIHPNSLENTEESKLEEIINTAIQFKKRAELLKIENDYLNTENTIKTAKISELERKMKEQNELLAEKSKEIALMKEKLKNFSRQPLQKSSIEKRVNTRFILLSIIIKDQLFPFSNLNIFQKANNDSSDFSMRSAKKTKLIRKDSNGSNNETSNLNNYNLLTYYNCCKFFNIFKKFSIYKLKLISLMITPILRAITTK